MAPCYQVHFLVSLQPGLRTASMEHWLKSLEMVRDFCNIILQIPTDMIPGCLSLRAVPLSLSLSSQYSYSLIFQLIRNGLQPNSVSWPFGGSRSTLSIGLLGLHRCLLERRPDQGAGLAHSRSNRPSPRRICYIRHNYRHRAQVPSTSGP